MEDVLAKAQAHIKWEEDEANFGYSSKHAWKEMRRSDWVERRRTNRRTEPYPYVRRDDE